MRYVCIDLFGKISVGKTTIFDLFTDPEKRYLQAGGNLSYDMRIYYARCWVLPRRWEHSMVFLADPKFDMKWQSLNIKFLQKMFEPTNILMIVTDSTPEDVDAVARSLEIYPRIKRSLIVFIIANMQDLPGRLSKNEIQKRTGIADILELVATDPGAKLKVEPFIEEATKRYFLMLSKKGEEMEFENANQGKKQSSVRGAEKDPTELIDE